MQSPVDRTPSPHDHNWRPPSSATMQRAAEELLGSTIHEALSPEEYLLWEEDSFADCDLVNVHHLLRKTVVCVGNTIYYTRATGISSFNIVTRKTQQVVNTQRPITSVLATTHFLVAGGPLGFVLLFDLKKEEVIWEGTIKGSTINALSFHYAYTKGLSEPEARLVVANNSPRHGVQFFRLPDMTAITSVVCPNSRNRTPIGGVQVSPNQKWIAAVGDNQHVFILKYNKDKEGIGDNSELYTLHRSIAVPGNCYDCSWAPHSQILAVSSEAGYLILLNLQGEIIHSYPAARMGSSFDKRLHSISSVKFSPSIDQPLIAFIHPFKYISIISYDPSDLTGYHCAKRQDISTSRLPNCKRYESIVGLDWTSSGSLVIGTQWSDPKDKFHTPQAGKKSLIEKSVGKLCILRDVKTEKTLKGDCIRYLQRNVLFFMENHLEELRMLPFDLQESIFGDVSEIQ